jgi:membrane-associated phospholipid phosphatase
MFTKTAFSNRNFIAAFMATLAVGLYLIIDSFIVGRNELFLMLNTDLGRPADYFFSFWTNLGDGIVWVVVAALFFIFQKNKLPLLIAAIIVSTLITQLTKNYVFPAEPRPTAAIQDINLIHTVPGVELHTAYSFPSGHTTTAFTIYLLACLFVKRNWIIPVGFVYAILVGYSRIYLAQHFPLDMGGGMITALITILISLYIQQQWEKRKPQI